MKAIFAALVTGAVIFSYAGMVGADEMKTIKLLPPQTEGGKPLMQALKERSSTRSFSSRELPPQVLSNLLWAACGVNRPGSGGMTAPTAMNMQEIDIYVAMKDGAYLYKAKSNELIPILSSDIRESTGKQDLVKKAPVNLIYVSDLSKMRDMSSQDADFYGATDTGFISENVYLYCSSSGLATVVRGWLDKTELAKAMKLRPDQRVILAQTVGYSEEK